MTEPIACRLTSERAVNERLAEWADLLATSRERTAIDGGWRFVFAATTDVVSELARLASAEADCCGWLDFTIGIREGEARLEIRAPAEAQTLLASIFGA